MFSYELKISKPTEIKKVSSTLASFESILAVFGDSLVDQIKDNGWQNSTILDMDLILISQGYTEEELSLKTLCSFSSLFPDKLITLTTWGEDWDDITVAYFKDGKYQISPVQIIFPKFDSASLREFPSMR